MENPYQSPQEPNTPFGPSAQTPFQPQPRGLVNHVRVLAILLIVQGALDLGVASVLGVMAVAIPRMMTAENFRQTDGPSPEQMSWIMAGIYGGLAVTLLAVAVLHIVAGFRNWKFRGRVLGFIALASGLLTVFTCYCLPLAVGLGIYGLIVYLNGPVSEAFRMGETGCPPNDILNSFQR